MLSFALSMAYVLRSISLPCPDTQGHEALRKLTSNAQAYDLVSLKLGVDLRLFDQLAAAQGEAKPASEFAKASGADSSLVSKCSGRMLQERAER